MAPICNLFSAEARKFYRWNCITIAINLAITTLLLNSLSGYGIISIIDPHQLFSFGLEDEVLPNNIMGIGSWVILIFGILVNVQEGLFAYWSCVCSCVHQNKKPLEHPPEQSPHSRKSSKMTVMTKEETVLISDSWDLVRQDLKGHGLKFFK